MSILTRFGALSLTLVPVLLGCQPGASGEPRDENVQAVRQADQYGSGSTNGLDTDLYREWETRVIAATELQLVHAEDGMDVNPDVAALMLTDKEGAQVFKYMVRCALPRDGEHHTTQWEGNSWSGDGVFENGEDWVYGPLSSTARYELLACMAAHLNPLGLEVDLLFSGPDTRNDSSQTYADFTVEEALWVARQNVDHVQYVVWPLKPFVHLCSVDPVLSLQDRVCGMNPSGCDLVQGNGNDCAPDAVSGGFNCLGQPALKTQVRAVDATILNPRCL